MKFTDLKLIRAKLGDKSFASSRTLRKIEALDAEIKERETELDNAYDKGFKDGYNELNQHI